MTAKSCVKGSIIIFSFFLAGFLTGNLYATTYYVDNTDGDDSQNGLTTSTAWKTVSKVNSMHFQPGNSILFKRGEIWQGPLTFTSSGTADAPIILGAYGEGKKPVISINWEFDGNWVKDEGNIWKIENLNFQPWRLRVNGVEKLQAVSKGEIDGQKYFWFIETDDPPWAVSKSNIYLWSEANPDSLLIQLNAIRFSLQLNGVHDVIVNGLDVQGGNDGCFSVVGCHDVMLTNDNIGGYARFGVTLSNSHDIVIDSCRVDALFEFQYEHSSLRGPGDGITTWGKVQQLEVKNSVIRTWGHNCIYFMGNNGPEDTENNVVHDCLLEGINSYSRAFETGGSASHNEFYNNIARHFTASSQVGGSGNYFHHNIFYDYKNSPVKDYPIGQVFTFQQFEGGPDKENRIENNVFADIDEQALNYIAGGEWNGPINHNTFKNNILYNVGRNSWRVSEKRVVIKWPSCDSVVAENYSNNCIYNPDGDSWIIYRGTKMTVEEFNQQNDSHDDTIGGNLNVDPIFIDALNHDYHLGDSSPCINAGIVTHGIEKDFDGNIIPYGTGPDIGAYEYIGKVPLAATIEYVTNPCDYGVHFTGHANSNTPPEWSWDFGDGHTSDQKNVYHSYDTAGGYLVQLVVTDTTGSDTATAWVFLTPVLPLPVVHGAERCGEGNVTLIAQGTGDTLKWFDAPQGGQLVEMGDTFHTPVLKETTTYYVASTILGETQTFQGGKTDTTAGQGGFYQWDDFDASWGLRFDAATDIMIKSVKVFNGVSSNGSYTGVRTFSVVNGSGEVVAQASVNVVMGEQRLQLNIAVPAGQGYALLSDRHVGLWRDEGGAVFPYVFGPVTITGMTRHDGLQPGGRENYYYFFYDWEVEATTDSASCRTPVTAVIHHVSSSAFTYNTSHRTTTFKIKSSADSCLWDFGDGQNSREEEPVHTFTQAGIYPVNLITWGSCGGEISSDTLIKEILVGNVPFLDYACIGEGYGYATVSSEEPYVPIVKIDNNKIIYISPSGGGDGSSEENPSTFSLALQQATEGTTILALDGEYKINLSMPEIDHVKIIAKNKWGAKIDCGSGNALDLGNTKNIHHINIIGFEIYGNDGGEFIFAAGDAKDIGTHHFYLSDIKFHDLKMGLYTGLHSHDWTVDRCMYYNSRMSYLWYMMGWHQTVMNSIMYNNTYYSIAIRGHYPLDEEFDYFHPENNIPITDRESSWLDSTDWTHMIIHNTFGTCTNTSRSGQTHMSIFYNKPSEDPPLQSEDVYFPPQNITIANNAFIDNGPIHKKPVVIFAERGINTGEPWSVNGIYITHNVTDKNKILVQEDYPIESIDLSTNTLNANNMNFLNEAGHDYRLTQESTDLLNKGGTAPFLPNTDFRANGRNEHPDIGAYEYYELPTSIQRVQEGSEPLTIFPNPASDYIRMDLPEPVKNGQVVIYNTLAHKVKIFQLKENNPRETKIIIHDLTRGLFMCVVYDQNGMKRYNGKFIVSR